jgi:nucleotidyltransferase substrate binding protein (TIGR01987 family)
VERLKERIEQADAALATLEELLDVDPTDVIRDAAIQRFEYSFEAVWKTAQRYLLVMEGNAEASPKSVIRSSVAAGLLKEVDGRMALTMVDDRNLTSHTYNESLAQRIFSVLPEYAHIMRAWLDAMGEKYRVSGR